MDFYFIRHGRQCSKLCNVNVELDQNGIRQAELLGQRLKPLSVEAVYSSDLIRAFQTAQTANQFLHVHHYVRPELREISYGEMEGMSDEEIEVVYRELKERRDAMTEDIPYPGGECAGDVVKRVMPFLEELTQKQDQRVAIVTHGGVIRSMAAHLLQMDLAKARLLCSSLENCSITHIRWDEKKQRFVLERLNDFAHLEAYPELLRKNW